MALLILCRHGDETTYRVRDEEGRTEQLQSCRTRVGRIQERLRDQKSRLYLRSHNPLVQGSNPCGPTNTLFVCLE